MIRCVTLLLLGICIAQSVSIAEETDAHTLPAGMSLDSSLRLRIEQLDWFKPEGSLADERYNFEHAKFQLGSTYQVDWLKVGVQVQGSALFDLPKNGTGPGAVYRATNGDKADTGDFGLRQAYLSGTLPVAHGGSITLGRFLYANGSEFDSKNADLERLKQQRLFNRLFGTFDFTFGRSFDGAALRLSPVEKQGFGVNYVRPTQGGFATDGSIEIEDIDLLTAAYSLEIDQFGPGEIQPFYYHYRDDRDTSGAKADNRPLTIRSADSEPISIHNFGASYLQILPFDNYTCEIVTWGVIQDGDWGTLDHRASAFASEWGTRFKTIPFSPKITFGYNWSSGDSDANDPEHRTFFQMLPTARQYALLPFYNSMNNEDAFVQLDLVPGETVKTSASLHWLRLQNGNDLLYSGGGANVNTGQFGFAGTSLNGSEEIGQLVDLSTSWAIRPDLSISVYYGHLFGGNGFGDFPDDDIDYGYLELSGKFAIPAR